MTTLTGMDVARDLYEARACVPNLGPITPNLGMARIPAVSPENGKNSIREELYQELIMLAHDLKDPERYGHAVPSEVVVRAARICSMTEAERRPVHGYDGPPPVRCEACEG